MCYLVFRSQKEHKGPLFRELGRGGQGPCRNQPTSKKDTQWFQGMQKQSGGPAGCFLTANFSSKGHCALTCQDNSQIRGSILLGVARH